MRGSVSAAVPTDNQGEMESEGEVVSSSKASKRDASPTVPWQETASIVVVEEVDVGLPTIVQTSTKEVEGAFGSFTDKTKGFSDVGGEGVDVGVPASLKIVQMITEKQSECLGLTQTRPKEYLMPEGKGFYDKRLGCCYRGVYRVLRLTVVQEISMNGEVRG